MRNKPGEFLEQHRLTKEKGSHPAYVTTSEFGMVGAFKIPMDDTPLKDFSHESLQCISDDGIEWDNKEGSGWEHISVSVINESKKKWRIPTWYEMCFVKELFFKPNEAVMQIHPPEEDYIDIHKDCLHLWRPINQDIPIPPDDLV